MDWGCGDELDLAMYMVSGSLRLACELVGSALGQLMYVTFYFLVLPL